MSCLSCWSHPIELIAWALASPSTQHIAIISWPFWNLGTTIVSTLFALNVLMFQMHTRVGSLADLACCTHAFVLATSSQMTFISHRPLWKFGIVTYMLVWDDPKLLDDGGEIPKSQGRDWRLFPAMKSPLYLTKYLPGGNASCALALACRPSISIKIKINNHLRQCPSTLTFQLSKTIVDFIRIVRYDKGCRYKKTQKYYPIRLDYVLKYRHCFRVNT